MYFLLDIKGQRERSYHTDVALPFLAFPQLTLFSSKQYLQHHLLQSGSDNAHSSCYLGRTLTDIALAGNHVKVQPLPGLGGCHHTLAAQNHTVAVVVQRRHDGMKLFLAECQRSLITPAGEHFICMMMVMSVAVIVSATARTVVVMVMIVMVVVMMFMVMVMVMSALALLVMIVVMTAAALSVLMMMVMLVLHLFQHLCREIGLLLDLFKDLRSAKLIPGGGDDQCIGIYFLQQFNTLGKLFLGNVVGTAE